MRPSLPSLGLSAALLLTSGCERLQDDLVFVYGRLERRDGSSVTDGVVPYARTAHFEPRGETNVEYVMPEFIHSGESVTDGYGDFFLETRYGDVQSANSPDPDLHQPFRFRAQWRDETGAGVFASFIFQDDVELPTLRIWDSQLVVTPGAEGSVVSFGAVPPLPVPPLTGEYAMTSDDQQNVIPDLPTTPEPALFIVEGDQPLFRVWAASSGWVANRFVLEDFARPAIMLRAHSLGAFMFFPLGGKHSPLVFRVDWRTEEVPLPPAGLRPVSRGASCEPSPPRGACPWTDGKLERVALGLKPVDGLTLTLEEPRSLRHVVVRGAEGSFSGFVVEGSLDAEQWTRLGVLRNFAKDYVPPPLNRRGPRAYNEQTQWDSPFDGRFSWAHGPHFLEGPLESVGPVRHVRLRPVSFDHAGEAQVAGEIRALGELSVFD
ncbi:hypothetical protein LXT21_21715 [Myxococcus sp. K38C18041901]|uniref:hypothetical protein n=1 Tax=Myxococcus guangdongensis TaxID=2906760 RepID=UPI0020A79B84|nr:hypothetical protein [Myxococcus guangdongensis]MCP3061404.1 hypothetical protein [Myxococcus guangdongensis]